jgi:DNA polymerase II small subunit/DNA polymerase delta subunit B
MEFYRRCDMVQKTLNITNQELLDELSHRGYFASKVPPQVTGKTFEPDVKRLSGDKYRFAVISCTQLGSKYQQLSHLYTFYSICKRRGIRVVLHCGDLVDGEKVYRGQEYELFVHGADAQRDYVVENYPKIEGISTKVILGNHDESFYKTAGYNIVKAVCSKREDMEYVGDYYATAKIDGIKVALMHGAGGVAYARSYKLQKIVEQLAPEQKPHMLFVGHWHIQAHIPAYRNVEAFSMGCFQSQTPFLTRLGLFPNIGGVILEVVTDETGIKSIKTEWIPFYVPKVNDF